MVGNWPQKALKPFIDKDIRMVGNLVKVEVNCSYKNKNIIVYNASAIENLICGYALAFANDLLRKQQLHIGKRAVTLMRAFVGTVLDAAIKEACGFTPKIQKTTQGHYERASELIDKFGFKYSVNQNIATKKDISSFLKVPISAPLPPEGRILSKTIISLSLITLW